MAGKRITSIYAHDVYQRPWCHSCRAYMVTTTAVPRGRTPVIILRLSIVSKTFYCNDNKITEFEIIDNKNSSTACVILYELIDLWVLDSNRMVGVWLLPWRWHILSILLIAGRGMSAEICGLDNVLSPYDLCSRPETIFFLYRSSGYRTYIYIHMECRSILVKLQPITVYTTGFGECAVSVLNATCCFLWFHQLCLALW